jgi:NADH-quinone oxidoreductase subunit G
VVAFSPFSANVEHADVLLPIAPFTETAGSFVNAEGRLQSFHGVVRPLGDTRPGWKVLRVLGNLLGLPEFAHDSVEQVRAEAVGDGSQIATKLSNLSTVAHVSLPAEGTGLQRLADVPIYCADGIVRRAASLQQTADAKAPVVSLPADLWATLGLSEGASVRVSQDKGSAVLAAVCDKTLASGTVRVPAGHVATAALGPMYGALSIERA